MELEQAADCLEALGSTTRLEIYRLLVHAGDAGLPVGELQDRLGIPASTLSHHLARLVNLGLVHQKREGRILRCTANYPLMARLLAFLGEECCRGVEPLEIGRQST